MYRIQDSVRSTHGQDGGVVLDIRRGQMFNLNPMGSEILELLKTGRSEPAIVETITQRFHVSREVVEGDVREFIESLRQHKLVEFSDASGQ
jgi:hypothetical protein